jgi:apolipoprotein N-acyltransferase
MLRLIAALCTAAAALETALSLSRGLAALDSAHLLLSAAHLGFSIVLLAGLFGAGRAMAPGPRMRALLFNAPEALLALAAVFFLFSYIFATNANMDYVQRFIASGGNIHLAPDSARERAAALLAYCPLLGTDLLLLAYARLALPLPALAALGSLRFTRLWALPLTLLAALAYALSFPSFAVRDGIPVLAYVCLIPLFAVLRDAPPTWAVFYGVLFGTVQTMITSFWLGTFNLVSLQFAAIVTAAEYLPFIAAACAIHRRAGKLAFLVFPAAWTLFDFLRSQGFLGYPWGMLGTTQYAIVPLIQTASLTGVWGLTFMVTLVNAAAEQVIETARRRERVRAGAWLTAVILMLAAAGGGAARVLWVDRAAAAAPARSLRLALVQQNADPRKDDYRKDFESLKRLTDRALPERPDMVVWSETAFVPNIRRWSREDPTVEPLAALVRDFLAYQKSLGTWLLTGNDDYALVKTAAGEERLDYNAAVLFSPQGERVETYHKMHLVPFTEYFPFKKQLPSLYALLKSFDVYLWEPGDIRTVFHHPLFSFSTPICFEDAFPADVRAFVRAGAEVVVNLTNDYWSLTEAEAMQHAVNALFRAVENGTPLVRAAASGLTCAIDPVGRLLARAPLYEEAVIIVDVPVRAARPTPYRLLGDWFPAVMAALLAAVLLLGRRGRR